MAGDRRWGKVAVDLIERACERAKETGLCATCSITECTDRGRSRSRYGSGFQEFTPKRLVRRFASKY